MCYNCRIYKDMDNLVIRPFKPDDTEQLAAITAHSFMHDWLRIVDLPEEQMAQFLIETGEISPYPFEGYMVAEKNGDILGLIRLKWAGQQIPKTELNIPGISRHGLSTAVKLLLMHFFFAEKPAKDTCHVSELAVKEQARRQGIATELLLFGKKFAAEKGFKKYTLNVDTRNKAALNLYSKMGFNIEKKHRIRLARWLFGTEEWFFMSQTLDTGEKP